MISLNQMQIPQAGDMSTDQSVSESGGEATKVNGMSIQAPAPSDTSTIKNLEGVQERSAVDNVAKLGLPELSSPSGFGSGGGYVQSVAAMFGEVTVQAANEQRRAAADVVNSSLESKIHKMLDAAKDIKEQSKLMMGLGIASSVVTTAMGFGGTVGGVKSMTAPTTGVASQPAAQVTANKLTLGKEIAEGFRASMDTGKESQVKSLDSDIKTTGAEEARIEQQMEQVKQFGDRLRELSQQALQIMQQVTSEANETTKRVLA